MEPYRRRLQLDRQELLLLFCVFVLVSGLMFTLGLMMGYGMKSRTEVAGASASEATHAGHAETSEHEGHASAETGGHALAGESHGDKPKGSTHAETKPSTGHAAEKTEKVTDSSEKKQLNSLEADKKKGLNEAAHRDGSNDELGSIQDAEAHFASNPQPANRAPASEDSDDDKVEKAADKPAEKIAERTNEKRVEGARVKSLFERRPASVDKFQPNSGAFTVQIASFATDDESSAKVKVLRQAGFNESYVQAIRLQNGEVWYRVAVGSYSNSSWAKKTGEKLVRQKMAGDFVIRKVP